MTNSEIQNDLEEAAVNWICNHKNGEVLYVKDAFIAGAKWQAEQDQETIELAEDHAYLAGAVNEREKMMKEAVETTVIGCDGYEPDEDGRWRKIIFPAIHTIIKQYSPGDKVCVIVLKKED